jgi:uncharacterized membrane protein
MILMEMGDAMTLLVLGSILFLGSHLIAVFGYRAKVEAMGGQHAYMGVVTIGSVISLIMVVMGYQQASYQQLWMPLPASHELATYLMPIATILLVAGNVPGNIGRYVKHPMLTGIAVWAFLHLLANGDLSSTIIFITFGGYAIYRRLTLQPKAPDAQPIYRDIVAVAGGLFVYGLFYYFHEALSGVGLL